MAVLETEAGFDNKSRCSMKELVRAGVHLKKLYVEKFVWHIPVKIFSMFQIHLVPVLYEPLCCISLPVHVVFSVERIN